MGSVAAKTRRTHQIRIHFQQHWESIGEGGVGKSFNLSYLLFHFLNVPSQNLNEIFIMLRFNSTEQTFHHLFIIPHIPLQVSVIFSAVAIRSIIYCFCNCSTSKQSKNNKSGNWKKEQKHHIKAFVYTRKRKLKNEIFSGRLHCFCFALLHTWEGRLGDFQAFFLLFVLKIFREQCQTKKK